jgi:GDPmannose 4,6-dehydratase
MKTALILGVGGQDGSYLAEHLLSKGYEVHGLCRRSSVDNLWRVRHMIPHLVKIHYGDLCDPPSVGRVVCLTRPDELYNEADQDHVGRSYDAPGYSSMVTGAAVGHLLEAVRREAPKCRVFQPLSATVFGNAPPAQNESTPWKPLSPYACAKAYAGHLCRYYREAHGLFVATAVMYNHDSPRRGGDYLLHKVCRAAAEVAAGARDAVPASGLNAVIDVGHAAEYMEAAHAIMSRPSPDDFVLSSGVPWTVGQVVAEALRRAGVPREGRKTTDDGFFRPGPAPRLIGDHSKARDAFGFNPQMGPAQLVGLLVDKYKADLAAEARAR